MNEGPIPEIILLLSIFIAMLLKVLVGYIDYSFKEERASSWFERLTLRFALEAVFRDSSPQQGFAHIDWQTASREAADDIKTADGDAEFLDGLLAPIFVVLAGITPMAGIAIELVAAFFLAKVWPHAIYLPQ
jgi:hypothetical protein